MAAEEHPGRKTAGSMLFFNVRNNIFAQWDAHMKTYLPRREPFFAYIVHGTRMGVDDEPDDDHWYDQQSNTVPIYITEVELTPEESYYFPKLLFPVMEVFIPGLILSKEEFPPERSNKLNALEYTGDQRRLFFENLKTSIEELHAYVLKQRKRQDAKHFGKSLGQVRAAIQGCGEEDPSNIEGDVNIPAPEGTLQTPQRYTRVLRPVKDFLAHYDTSISWLSKEDWVLEQKRTQLVYDSELGALGKDATPLQMLGLLEEELKSCLEVTKRGASIRGVIMCSLVSKKLNQPPKKARIAKEQTTMIHAPCVTGVAASSWLTPPVAFATFSTLSLPSPKIFAPPGLDVQDPHGLPPRLGLTLSSSSTLETTVTSKPDADDVDLAEPEQSIGNCKGNSDDKETERLCIICMEESRQWACVPCGHMLVCDQDLCKQAIETTCPFCNGKVIDKIRIYVS